MSNPSDPDRYAVDPELLLHVFLSPDISGHPVMAPFDGTGINIQLVIAAPSGWGRELDLQLTLPKWVSAMFRPTVRSLFGRYSAHSEVFGRPIPSTKAVRHLYPSLVALDRRAVSTTDLGDNVFRFRDVPVPGRDDFLRQQPDEDTVLESGPRSIFAFELRLSLSVPDLREMDGRALVISVESGGRRSETGFVVVGHPSDRPYLPAAHIALDDEADADLLGASLRQTIPLFECQGPGVPLDLTLRFSSEASLLYRDWARQDLVPELSSPPFGQGWGFIYGLRVFTLVEEHDRTTGERKPRLLGLRDATGEVTVFGLSSSNPRRWYAQVPKGSWLSLLFNCEAGLIDLEDTGSGFVLRDSGTFGERQTDVYRFDRDGYLVEISTPGFAVPLRIARSAGRFVITDSSGRQAACITDGRGRVTQIVDPAGRSWSFEYDGPHLVGIDSPDGDLYTFTYDDRFVMSDKLTGVGGRVQYRYRFEEATDQRRLWGSFGEAIAANRDRGTLRDRFRYADLRVPFGITQTLRVEHENRRGFVTRYDWDPIAGSLTETSPSGAVTVETFDRIGQASETRSPLGHVVQAFSTVTGAPTRVIDPDGTRQEFDYAGTNRHRPVRYAGGAVVEEYEYVDLPGATDRLSKVTRTPRFAGAPPLVVTYEWEAPGILVGETESPSERVRFEYDGAGPNLGLPRRVIHCVGEAITGEETFDYDAFGRLNRHSAADGTYTYDYDVLGNETLEEVAQDGAVVSRRTFVRDRMGRLLRVLEDDGSRIDLRLDVEGLVLTVTRTFADGSVERWSHEYDPCGNQTRMVDPEGQVVRWEYTPEDRLAREIHPGLATIECAYDADGNLREETTADADGNREVVTLAHDPIGEVKEVRYPELPLPDGTPGTWRPTVTIERHFNGRLKRFRQEIRPGEFAESEYDLDGAGRPYRVRRTFPEGTHELIETLDPLGRLETQRLRPFVFVGGTVDPRAPIVPGEPRTGESVLRFEHDCRNRLTAIRDNRGQPLAALRYDDANALLAIQTPDPRETGRVLLREAETREYDAAGRVRRVAEVSGTVVDYTYDGQGRVDTITHGSAGAQRWRHDAQGRVASVVSEAPGEPPHEVVYGYGPSGEQTLIRHRNRHPSGAVSEQAVRLAYDGNGRLAEKTDALGRPARMRYDALGNLAAVQVDGQTVSYSYDACRRVVGVSYAPGPGGARFAYDGTGNLTFAENDVARCTWRYDAVGRPLSREVFFKDGAFTKTLRWEYDPYGLLAAREDGDGTRLRFRWDDRDRLTEMFLGAEREPIVRQTRMPWGGLRRRTLVRGGFTTTYAYDAAGRTATVRHAGAAGNLAAFSYLRDAAGRVTRAVRTGSLEQVLDLAYDARGRLARQVVTGPGGRVERDETYAYDSIGNRVSMTRGTSGERGRYDPANQLVRWDAGQRVPIPRERLAASADSALDPAHEAGRAIDGDTTDARDAAWVSDDQDTDHALEVALAPAATVARVELWFPAALGPAEGLRLEGRRAGGTWEALDVIDVEGGRLDGGAFDALRSRVRLDLQPVELEGVRVVRPAGQGFLSAPDPGDATRFALVEIALSTAQGRVVDFAYDAMGRRIRKGAWSYAYDPEGRLLRVTGPDTDIEYAYGPDGRPAVVRDRITGEVRYRLYDGIDLYAEYDQSGRPVRTYLREPEGHETLGFLRHEPGADPDLYFLLTDERGSVVHVVDDRGNPVSAYSYDVWGNVLESRETAAASVPQPLRFMSKPYDERTGLYAWHMRAYDPEFATFLQRDPAPDSGHPYVFLNNDPANARDPLGLWAWLDTLVETIKEVPGVLYEDFASGAAAGRLKSFAAGTAQGAVAAVKGTIQAVTHPVETVQAIGHAIVNYDQVIAKIGEEWDELVRLCSQDPDRFAEAIGRLTGNLMAGAAIGAGQAAVLAKAVDALRATATVSRVTQVAGRTARQNRIPDRLKGARPERIELPDGRPKWPASLVKRLERKQKRKYNSKKHDISHGVPDEFIRSFLKSFLNQMDDLYAQWRVVLAELHLTPAQVGGRFTRRRLRQLAKRLYEEKTRFFDNLKIMSQRKNRQQGGRASDVGVNYKKKNIMADNDTIVRIDPWLLKLHGLWP